MERIATFGGISIDFERVKNIILDCEFLTIEYNIRTEYVKNPFTDEVEKNKISDTFFKEFSSSDSARNFNDGITNYWNVYLQDNL